MTITQNQRLQLIGLLTLAEKANDELDAIKTAALAITGEPDDMGHTADAVYDSGRLDADALLKRLNITVSDQ